MCGEKRRGLESSNMAPCEPNQDGLVLHWSYNFISFPVAEVLVAVFLGAEFLGAEFLVAEFLVADHQMRSPPHPGLPGQTAEVPTTNVLPIFIDPSILRKFFTYLAVVLKYLKTLVLKDIFSKRHFLSKTLYSKTLSIYEHCL